MTSQAHDSVGRADQGPLGAKTQMTPAIQGDSIRDEMVQRLRLALGLNFVNRALFSSLLVVTREQSPKPLGDGEMEGCLF